MNATSSQPKRSTSIVPPVKQETRHGVTRWRVGSVYFTSKGDARAFRDSLVAEIGGES